MPKWPKKISFFPSFEPYLSKQNQHFQAFRVCENLHAAFWRKDCEFSNGNATAAKVCFNSGIGTLSVSITKPWLLTVAALLKLGGRGHGVNMGQMPDAGVIISPQRAWGCDCLKSIFRFTLSHFNPWDLIQRCVVMPDVPILFTCFGLKENWDTVMAKLLRLSIGWHCNFQASTKKILCGF